MLHVRNEANYTLWSTLHKGSRAPPEGWPSRRKGISVRFLVSICNQRAEPVKLPGTYLFEVDSDRQTVTPATLHDARLHSCVGITGLARQGDELLALVQSLSEPCMLVRFGIDYRVKNVWPLASVADGHSLTVASDRIFIASTGTDSIVEFTPGSGESVLWQDNDFGEDTIHLNSVLWLKGCLYATAFGKKTAERWSSATLGYLFNVSTGRVLAEPIAHPHSATVSLSSPREGIYYCASTHQTVCREDGQKLHTGSGFTRGLIVTATHIYVGISKHRGALTDPCGVRVYQRHGDSLANSRLVASIDLSPYGQEIYDLLPL